MKTSSMKAAYIERPGPPENIIYGDLPIPRPQGSQVLVRVEAVALNPVDTYIRSGSFKMDLPQPYILGCDLAGVVEDVGPEASRFSKGARVWGSNQGVHGRQGTFAEYAVVDECWLYPIPEEVSFQDAAAMALVGITAHLGLFHKAGLKSGERVFVNGGTGGVGSCVVQMARAIGARVMTTAGTDQKVRLCRRLGAEVAVNYKSDDVEAALQAFGPIDVWFETLREQDVDRIIRHMALGGRIVVMAGCGARPPFPVGAFYGKDCSLFGFVIFNAPPEQQRKCAAEINRWMARARVRPLIDRVMGLHETAAAHRLQEENTLLGAGTLCGKIVLVPRGRGDG